MTITLNGTTGITSDGGYTGDGVSFADGTPANTLVTTTGGNVGIGTSSPISNSGYGGLTLNGTSGSLFSLMTNGTESGRIASLGNETSVQCKASTGYITFVQGVSGGTERARIDSSGKLLVGKTSVAFGTAGVEVYPTGEIDITASAQATLYLNRLTSDGNIINFYRTGNQVGNISVTGSATAYNTSSDYRLKENIAPMTGALATVQALKPCTYTWKADGSDGQGFIAHELQAVVPECVTGEKDAVDADGNPVYQGIDTSFLVATLTSAIQELKAELDTVKTQLADTNLTLTSVSAELATLKGTV